MVSAWGFQDPEGMYIGPGSGAYAPAVTPMATGGVLNQVIGTGFQDPEGMYIGPGSGAYAPVVTPNQVIGTGFQDPEGMYAGPPATGGVLNQATGNRMQDLFAAAGIPWGALSPTEQFGQFATTQFRPGPSRMRSAFYDVQQPLLQQYYLQQPRMTAADYPGYTGPTYGGFEDFIGRGFAGQEDIRGLAEQAATMARMPGAQFFQYVDPQEDYTGAALTAAEKATLTGITPAQQLMYRDVYGTGQQAAANQAQLANLLALQRGGGGLYGGAMGQAITGALGELQSQLMARNPEANFLDWYLQRTEGAPTVGGFLSA